MARCLVIVAAASILAACTTLQRGTPLTEARLSAKAVVLEVPVVLQNDRFDCGVSALSMLLAYYGQPCDPAKADELRAKATQEEGLTGGELEDYLKSEGLSTALFKGELGDTLQGLYYHLDRGRPLVIALHNPDDSNHFVLVSGYDPVNKWILLQDPRRGSLVFASGDLEYAWSGAGNFTLLATPAE